ncbi:MAG: hypothetical protein ACE5KU_06740, partial [Nitrososphaerales archaeon]
MGGVSVMLGFIGGIALLLIFSQPIAPFALAGIIVIILTFGVGVLDDITGMRQRYKPFIIAAAAVPMILTYEGAGSLWLPLIGSMSFGVLYPLILIPLAVTTSANFANMLAGFNGLEAGIGAIGLGTLGFLSFVTGHWDIGLIALTLAAAFTAFLKYNWYPAKIFLGDSGTLLYGASIAVIGIVAELEFAAIMVSMPAAFDFTLKMLHRRPFAQRRDYGDTRVTAEGTLEPAPYPALSHAFLKVSNLSERRLVAIILAMESLYAIIAILLTLTLR